MHAYMIYIPVHMHNKFLLWYVGNGNCCKKYSRQLTESFHIVSLKSIICLTDSALILLSIGHSFHLSDIVTL